MAVCVTIIAKCRTAVRPLPSVTNPPPSPFCQAVVLVVPATLIPCCSRSFFFPPSFPDLHCVSFQGRNGFAFVHLSSLLIPKQEGFLPAEFMAGQGWFSVRRIRRLNGSTLLLRLVQCDWNDRMGRTKGSQNCCRQKHPCKRFWAL